MPLKNPFKGRIPETEPQTIPVKKQEPDYKLSSVSPEGTFIPPSPPEKSSFLSKFRHNTPTIAAVVDDDSGFVIPRASFDSYRRSFDIRPSMEGDTPSRQQSYQKLHGTKETLAPPLERNDDFEEIKLDDPNNEPTKKRFWQRKKRTEESSDIALQLKDDNVVS